MPEGDTVWQSAAPAPRGAGRPAADPLRSAGAPAGHRRPRRADVLGRRPARQALLTRVEGGLTLHSHLRMDGAWQGVAGRSGERVAAAGPATRSARCSRTAAPPPSATASPCWNCCAPTRRTGRSATSGPICSAPTGTRPRPLRRLLADPGPPARRSAAGPAQPGRDRQRLRVPSSASSPGTSPWTPVGELPEDLPGRILAAAQRLLDDNKGRLARRTTRAPAGPTATGRCGSTDGPAAPATAAGRRSPQAPTARPTGSVRSSTAPAASRARAGTSRNRRG